MAIHPTLLEEVLWAATGVEVKQRGRFGRTKRRRVHRHDANRVEVMDVVDDPTLRALSPFREEIRYGFAARTDNTATEAEINQAIETKQKQGHIQRDAAGYWSLTEKGYRALFGRRR